MEQAKRDQNHVPVALGATKRTDQTMQLRVDPSTGRLLVAIYAVPDATPGPVSSVAKRDQNHVPVGLAITNDSDQEIRNLITSTEPNRQYLFCDVLIEP